MLEPEVVERIRTIFLHRRCVLLTSMRASRVTSSPCSNTQLNANGHP